MPKAVKNHTNAHVDPTISPCQIIPPLSYILLNLFISLVMIASSFTAFFLTLFIIFPLACLRALLPADIAILEDVIRSLQEVTNSKDGEGGAEEKESLSELQRNKVVLILGDSPEIGFGIIKQYANEQDTVIIVASTSMDILLESILSLGETPAIVIHQKIDLTWPDQKIADDIRVIDQRNGPITHFFEVGGHLLNDGSKISTISGTMTAVLFMYDLMKERRYGKICVAGSLSGNFVPENTVSYSFIKACIDMLTTSLLVFATPCGVDIMCVQPNFIGTQQMQGSTVGQIFLGSAEEFAARLKEGVEKGGQGILTWPESLAVMYALRGLNPICERIGKWILMKR